MFQRILELGGAFDVIVVDDSSPDGTAEKAETFGERVRVLKRVGVRGYGSAVVAGFKEALQGNANLVVGMDADFSHDPAIIPNLIEKARDADVVIGSRYCPDGGTLNWPLYLNTLGPKGRLHFVGAVLEPVEVPVFSLLVKQLSVSASPLGSPAITADMLEFCRRHDIAPQIEVYKMSQVNDALEHLKSGEARYRIVLQNDL